ncbi:MAG: hypothetical protein ACTHXA_09270 [Gulosibacter sp.]|uniref:hypothetical protein n=1 Tax=Gulosibacter sp. TaxID=2817531 RepID=UPI003F919E37
MTDSDPVTETSKGPIWDAQRSTAPERPSIPTGLIEEEQIERPRSILIAHYLVFFGVAAFLGVVLSGIIHLDEIRDSFIAVLNDNLEEDYSLEDKERAVYFLLGIFGAIALMITFGLLIASNSIKGSKNSAGRVILIVLTLLFIPFAFLVATLRENNWFELLLTGIAVVAFIAAAVLYWQRSASVWLRQSDKRPAAPLTSFRDAAGNPVLDLAKVSATGTEDDHLESEAAVSDDIRLEDIQFREAQPDEGQPDSTTRET